MTRRQSWTVTSTAAFRRGYARLPESVAAAVAELVEGALRTDPTRVGKPLNPPYAGSWVARRGSYRLVFGLDRQRRVVTLEAVAHRRDVYQGS